MATLEDIKDRARQEQGSPAPLIAETAEGTRRQLPKAVAEELGQLERELAAGAVADVRVPLGELPEHLKAKVEGKQHANTRFDNAKVQARIEAACKEMDFGDLVITGRVVQDVPIIKKALVVRYQTLLGTENMWMDLEVGKQVLGDWAARSTWLFYMRLAFSVVSINGKTLPSHLTKDGAVDLVLANARLGEFNKLPERFVELVAMNFNWFNDRVEKLFEDDFEQLKNG